MKSPKVFSTLPNDLNTPTLLQSNKESRYFRLLHFARLSKSGEDRSESDLDTTPILEDLNSLADNPIPAIRPILPLIYHNVGLSGLRDQLHPKTQSLLKDLTLRLIAAELCNRQWFLHHLELFQKEGIPVILLKGAALGKGGFLLCPTSRPWGFKLKTSPCSNVSITLISLLGKQT